MEAQYVGNQPLFRHANLTADNVTDIPLNITEYTVTEDPLTTTIAAITSAVMLNDTTTDNILNNTAIPNVATVAPAKLDDVFYIYIWAAAIFGCIVITSGRFVHLSFISLKSILIRQIPIRLVIYL